MGAGPQQAKHRVARVEYRPYSLVMTEIVERAVGLLEIEIERANGDVYKMDLEPLFLKMVEEGWTEDESSEALEKGEQILGFWVGEETRTRWS